MLKTVLCLATMVVALAGVVSAATPPPTPLSEADLQIAVGACEAVLSLQEVKCNVVAVACPATQAPCAITVWNSGCVGVNSPKPGGTGTQNHIESQCTNTYSSGKCKWTPGIGGGCGPDGTTTVAGLQCGTRMTAASC